MKNNNNNPKFEARVYPTQTDITYVSISWKRGNRLYSEKITFDKQIQALEVDLPDKREYIVSFNAKRKDLVRVALIDNFKVTTCDVTLKERETE